MTPHKYPIKAFLSHSSKDKRYADLVASQFSSANLHYDEKTFEQGEQSSAEIFDALSRCDVFVLLLSKSSISSPWVQAEIANSQHRVFGGSISKVIVFVIDDLPSSEIPEWLRMYVHRRSANVAVISNVIKSALLELERSRNPSINLFVGRDSSLALLKNRLADVSDRSPQALYIAGWDGIGRRTLIRRAMADVYSSLVGVPVEVTLRRDQGDIEVYRELLSKSGAYVFSELIDMVDQYSSQPLEDRIVLLANQLDKLSDDRQIVVIRGSDALLQDNGDFKAWLQLLIENISEGTWPKLALVSQRMLAPSRQFNHSKTFFLQVPSLTIEDRTYAKSIEIVGFFSS